jgi:hypothetical protein
MALVVLGLFVLVWIISAVVKASQSAGPPRNAPVNRPRPNPDARVERTSDTDIDRFMAEIDRLRRRGEGTPAARPAEPASRPVIIDRSASRPESQPRPRPTERQRERRPRPTVRPAALSRPEPVPVLRPIVPVSPSASPPAPPPPPPAKVARVAKAAKPLPEIPNPVLQTLQSVLKSKQGPAVAFILSEILGDPPGRRAMMGGKRSM